jgi:hypothetical protein
VRLVAFLPAIGFEAGTFHIVEADTIVFGPVPAHGRADHPGPGGRESAQPEDHRAGIYRVDHLVDVESARHDAWGPHILALEPVGGPALAMPRRGRAELGIHGGPLHADGCLRLDEAAIRAVAGLVRPRLLEQRLVLYECRLVG